MTTPPSTGRVVGLTLGALALVAVGCATARPTPRPTIREATDAEKQRIREALSPLMVALDYPTVRTPAGSPCVVALGVLPVSAINASVGPGRGEPCLYFQLVVTEGALASLPPRELRAVLAHELGHVHLGHFARAEDRRRTEAAWSRRKSALADVLAVVPVIGAPASVALAGVDIVSSAAHQTMMRAFSREDESAADQFAVNLLDRVSGADGCLGLAEVFERLAQSGRPSVWEWRSTHPAPDRRAERVRAACEADILLPRPAPAAR
jgi:Zn-dependent protease with chaperone function